MLHHGIPTDVETARQVCDVCVILHNVLIERGDAWAGTVDTRDTYPAQWGLDRVPYGSADFVLQAAAGSPQSAKWLQVGPICAGSLLAQQISGRSARMFSALSLLVWIIQMLRRCSARAVLLLYASITPRRRGVISLPPIGSRYRHSAADLMLKTCAASAAKCQVSTDPAQKMCAATGVRQRPVTFYQQISCMSKRIKACRRQKKTRDHAGPFWHKILAPSRCLPTPS